eukprot:356265-Chlamydomonas_euryale.AAC.1
MENYINSQRASTSPQDPGGNTPVAAAAGGKGGDGGSALPWSLSLVTFLPALRALRPPTLPWLRDFFDDLRPQERHVSDRGTQDPWPGIPPQPFSPTAALPPTVLTSPQSVRSELGTHWRCNSTFGHRLADATAHLSR